MLNPRSALGSRLGRNTSNMSVNVASARELVEESKMPERLGDPCHDRKMPEVTAPFVGTLSDDLLFPVEGMPDWRVMIQLFQGEGKLTKVQAMTIISGALHLLKREPNVIRVSFPATIVGDIHGQVFDLIK